MQEMTIALKCRDMIQYGYVALRQYPKHERHVLSAETRSSMLTLLRLIITAGKRYHKKTTLTELDIELAVLRNQVRLGFELRYMDTKKYEQWSARLAEIGRMIHGWISSQQAPSVSK